MFVCCECCVLSGGGLCEELITRPEESYRLRWVVMWDLETLRMRRPWPALGRSATAKKKDVQSTYSRERDRKILWVLHFFKPETRYPHVTWAHIKLTFYFQLLPYPFPYVGSHMLISIIWWLGVIQKGPLACWDHGLESHLGHEYLSVVMVVCCQVEVSATSWSLVQRSPTDCAASLCVI